MRSLLLFSGEKRMRRSLWRESAPTAKRTTMREGGNANSAQTMSTIAPKNVRWVQGVHRNHARNMILAITHAIIIAEALDIAHIYKATSAVNSTREVSLRKWKILREVGDNFLVDFSFFTHRFFSRKSAKLFFTNGRCLWVCGTFYKVKKKDFGGLYGFLHRISLCSDTSPFLSYC